MYRQCLIINTKLIHLTLKRIQIELESLLHPPWPRPLLDVTEGCVCVCVCVCVSVLVTQSCLTLCDPRDCSPPGFSAHEVLQAKILEWVAIPFSKQKCTGGVTVLCICRNVSSGESRLT